MPAPPIGIGQRRAATSGATENQAIGASSSPMLTALCNQKFGASKTVMEVALGVVLFAATAGATPIPPVPEKLAVGGTAGHVPWGAIEPVPWPTQQSAIEKVLGAITVPRGGRIAWESVRLALMPPRSPEPGPPTPSVDLFDGLASAAAAKLRAPPLPLRRTTRLIATPSGAARAGALVVPDGRLSGRFDLAKVRAGLAEVPRLFQSRLPPELPRLTHVAARKRAFIETLLPLLLRANQRILAIRERLAGTLVHLSKHGALDNADMDWLVELADEFEVTLSERRAISELMRRVDVVPPSLALAQAAEESGWGTSRFALQGNAVFGQRTWTKGAGIVPKRRDPGKRHEVKAFADLRQSVAAYVRNLNTHPAYARLRAERAALRRRGAPLAGDVLAGALDKYSERGAEYVDTIRRIIRVNQLDQFDAARLQPRHVAWFGADAL